MGWPVHLWWRREANEDRFLVVVTFVGQGGFSFSSDAGLSGAQYALLFFILFIHFDLIIYRRSKPISLKH